MKRSYTTLNEEVSRIKTLMKINEGKDTPIPYSIHLKGNYEYGQGIEIKEPYNAGVNVPEFRNKVEGEMELWGELSTLIRIDNNKKIFTLIDRSTKDKDGRLGVHTISMVFDNPPQSQYDQDGNEVIPRTIVNKLIDLNKQILSARVDDNNDPIDAFLASSDYWFDKLNIPKEDVIKMDGSERLALVDFPEEESMFRPSLGDECAKCYYGVFKKYRLIYNPNLVKYLIKNGLDLTVREIAKGTWKLSTVEPYKFIAALAICWFECAGESSDKFQKWITKNYGRIINMLNR